MLLISLVLRANSTSPVIIVAEDTDPLFLPVYHVNQHRATVWLQRMANLQLLATQLCHYHVFVSWWYHLMLWRMPCKRQLMTMWQTSVQMLWRPSKHAFMSMTASNLLHLSQRGCSYHLIWEHWLKKVSSGWPNGYLSSLYTGLRPSCHLWATRKMVRMLSGRPNPESSVFV